MSGGGDVQFRVLGPVEVTNGAGPLRLGGRKQRALLGDLILHAGAVVSTTRLIDDLWGEDPPPTAEHTVETYISRLRRILRDAAAPDIVLTRAPGYVLDVESARVDAHRFERLIREGTAAAVRGDDREALALLGAALELWRGEPFEDLVDAPFAQAAARRLADLRLLALESRIELQLRGGRAQELTAELEALVAAHPYRETFHAQLMLALYRSGRQTEALAVFRRARALLVDELGIEPGPELRKLEQAILTQDPALQPPSGERGRPPATAAWRVRRGGLLIGVGGVVLLAVIAIVAAALAGSSASSVRVLANSVAVIDVRTDRVAAAVAVGARPAAIAFGSGSLWVANVDDQTASRIDPGTLRTLRTIPVGAPPTGIAASPDGI
jgi:YVTN family beta-propeller protein